MKTNEHEKVATKGSSLLMYMLARLFPEALAYFRSFGSG